MILSQTLLRGRAAVQAEPFLACAAGSEPDARAREPIEDEFARLDPTILVHQNQSVLFDPQATSLNAIQRLGPYRLLRQLGSGGMGIVFEAEDSYTGNLLAVKVLRPTLMMDKDAKLRFFNEAQAMASIAHPRIVPVLRVGEDQGIPYIAMPLLLGETLEDRLQHAPELTLDEVVRIGIEIAEGLDAAHRHGLIHRDVKPANVWLEEPFGSIRLLDLGLAREITKDSLLTHSGIVMGTPAFMSPEQGRGEKLDPRSDLFSLGCILYQMTTGFRPFEGLNPVAVLHELEHHHPPRVSARNPAVPTMLSNLIMELLAKNPKDRPPSAEDVMERLRRIPLHEAVRPYVPGGSNPSLDFSASLDADDALEMEKRPATPIGNWLVFSFSLLVASCGLWYLAVR